MLKDVIDILKKSEACAWEITDTVKHGWEFYYIGDRLDQNRIRDTEDITLNVYSLLDDGTVIGSAGGFISPSASYDECEKEIAALVANASYVKNPFYRLRSPQENAAAQGGADITDIDVSAIAKEFIDVTASFPYSGPESVNSFELFVDRVERRYINSNGVDVKSVYPSSMLEVVVNAADKEREVELYRMFTSGSCDPAHIRSEMENTFRYGADRLKAVPTPSINKADVIFSSSDAIEIYKWFTCRCNTAHQYIGYSDRTPGSEVVPYTDGDRITLTALKELPNSSCNTVYDTEGALMRDITLIENGTVKARWGSRQFAEYLKDEGAYLAENYRAEGGTGDAAALRSGRFLEVVEFSDFQVDETNGDLGGEIRLGYLHDGDEVTIVSGGSISGSMVSLAPSMKMSRELKRYDKMEIPAVTRLYNVTVTGAK